MIIHVKTPKTGTTSIDAYARMNIAESHVFEIDQSSASAFDNMSDEEIRQLYYVTGHSVTSKRIERIRKLHPECFVFTAFREPVSWVVSHYNYRFRFKKRGTPRWMYVRDPRRSQIAWYIVRIKGSIAKVFMSRSWRPSKLYNFLYEDVDLVIPTKEINVVVPQLFHSLGLTANPDPLPRRNSAGNEIPRKWSLTGEENILLTERYRQDLEFYEYVYKRFREDWMTLSVKSFIE